MWAAYVGNEKSVAILLEGGAETSVRNMVRTYQPHLFSLYQSSPHLFPFIYTPIFIFYLFTTQDNKRAIDIAETKECKSLLKKAAQVINHFSIPHSYDSFLFLLPY